MKIVYLTDDFPPQSFGGAGIIAYNLAKGFSDQGDEVVVITTVRDQQQVGWSEQDGFRVYKIYADYPKRWRPYLSVYNPKVLAELKEVLVKIRPDIVHAHNVHSYLSFAALPLAKKYSSKVFLTTHDALTIYGGKLDRPRRLGLIDQLKFFGKSFNPVRNFMIKYYLRSVDKIFAVSRALASALIINGIKNVVVVHNGVNPDDWSVSSSQVDEFKQKNNLVGKKIILFGGRLSGPKGGEAIIRALPRVVAEVPEVVLMIAGQKDSYAEKLVQLASGLDVGGHLVWLGWVERENMKLVYGASDIVTVPSLYLDPFPTVNLEAMATGKPVVGTNHGGTPEAVVDRETGYVVDPIDQDSFSAKLVELLTHTSQALEMGVAGRRRVEKDFTLQKQLATINDWYKKI